MRRAARLVSIVQLLRRHRLATAQKLAERLEAFVASATAD